MSQSLKFSPGTILLLEHDLLVHKFLRRVLDKNGFTVLSAATAEEALRIEAEFAGKLDVLLAAFTMPGLSAPELAETLEWRRPELQVMLMSSYADVQTLAFNHGWRFIRKPFSASALLDVVTEILALTGQALGARG